MRRLALAVLLLLAGPGFASAQCGYTAYAVGNPYACGIAETDGFVDCWGLTIPAGVPASTGASGLGLGQAAGCLIKSSDSTLVCWDDGGNSLDTGAPAGAFTAVACGAVTCCGITGGSINCWGDGESLFDEAPPGTGTWTQISGSDDTYCARKSDGALACWGMDAFSSGVISGEPAGTYNMVSGGPFHACAVKTADSTIACWGENGSGESTPPAGTFTDVAVGDTSTCAIKTNNGVECWGAEGWSYGTPPTNCDFISIESYYATNFCARDTENNISCWGWDEETTTEDPDSCPITPTTCPEPGASGGYCVTFIGG